MCKRQVKKCILIIYFIFFILIFYYFFRFSLTIDVNNAKCQKVKYSLLFLLGKKARLSMCCFDRAKRAATVDQGRVHWLMTRPCQNIEAGFSLLPICNG